MSVVSTETAGLGNRVKSWVSAWRLDPDARVYWPITPNMPASFGDLFENDCAVAAVPAGATPFKSWRLAVLPEDEADLPERFSPVNSTGFPLWRSVARFAWTLRGRPDDRYRYMVFAKSHSKRSARRCVSTSLRCACNRSRWRCVSFTHALSSGFFMIRFESERFFSYT